MVRIEELSEELVLTILPCHGCYFTSELSFPDMFAERLAIFVVKHVTGFFVCSSRHYRAEFPNGFNSGSGTSSKFLLYCNTNISKNGRNGNMEEAEAIFKRMPIKNTISWTAMLTAYYQNGQISKARKLFDIMPERNTASYNAMITAYNRENMIDEAFGLFSIMPDRNVISYGTMISGFVQAGKFDMAEKLYNESLILWKDPVSSNVLINGYLRVGKLDEAVKVFDRMDEKDVISWSAMINGYCKMGRTIDARDLFDKMPQRNVITWTTMIDGHMKLGNFEAGMGLFLDSRREKVEINNTTFSVLIEACGSFCRYREGIELHGLVLRLGFEFDVFLCNSMITMYSKCDSINAAALVFRYMTKKDVVTWNSMIRGFVQSEMMDEALELFNSMPRKDLISWTTMIGGFFNQGMAEKSIQLFEMMPKKDNVAWTAVISGFVNNEKYEEALHFFTDMLRNEIVPNPLTLSSVLSAASDLATLNQGLQIHALAVKMVMEFDISVQNSLVSMYAKCGNIADASRVFSCIKAPNTVSINSMITGLAQNGFSKEAITLFGTMEDIGQTPNEVTFLGILSACVHAGLVDEGRKYFEMMKSSHDVEIGPDHYACMVDLLGRAGLLDDAMSLIQSMPFESHSGVWGAILCASKIHMRLDTAKLACQNLVVLEPYNATPYVVLSNLHNISDEKNHGERIRQTKIAKGIKKSPGCSWIILKEKVHLFFAGDKSHMDTEKIHIILSTVAMEMTQLEL